MFESTTGTGTTTPILLFLIGVEPYIASSTAKPSTLSMRHYSTGYSQEDITKALSTLETRFAVVSAEGGWVEGGEQSRARVLPG